MSEFVNTVQVEEWFSDLEDALKNQIVSTSFVDSKEREQLYFLYQSAQLLRARFYEDFPAYATQSFEVSEYDKEDNQEETPNDN